MLKTVYAMAGAAAIVAAAVSIPALVNASAPIPGQKGDIADMADCELRGWPYYARSCVRDESRNAGGRAVKVRIVAPDRLPAWELKAASGLGQRYPEASMSRGTETQPDGVTVAPAGWMMAYSEARLNLDAGDFIRRTVR
jgi:hypothetical protein